MNKIKHLKVIEYTITHTGWYEVEMVALYNESRISEDTVRELIEKDKAGINPFVAVMYKNVYENLFDLDNTPVDDFQQDLMLEQKEQM